MKSFSTLWICIDLFKWQCCINKRQTKCDNWWIDLTMMKKYWKTVTNDEKSNCEKNVIENENWFNMNLMHDYFKVLKHWKKKAV